MKKAFRITVVIYVIFIIIALFFNIAISPFYGVEMEDLPYWAVLINVLLLISPLTPLFLIGLIAFWNDIPKEINNFINGKL